MLENLAGVQESIQQDRAEFYAAGILNSDDKQNVIVEADVIRIEPVDPQVIYLPVYDSAALVEAIRAGDATLAAQPAPPSAEGAGTATDAAAQAEAAAQAAKEAAAASQQAATQAQAAAEQSAGSASRPSRPPARLRRRPSPSKRRRRRPRSPHRRRWTGPHQLRRGTGILCRPSPMPRR